MDLLKATGLADWSYILFLPAFVAFSRTPVFFLIEKWNGRRHWGLKEVQGILFQNIGIWLNNPVCLEGTNALKVWFLCSIPSLWICQPSFWKSRTAKKPKRKLKEEDSLKVLTQWLFEKKNAVVPQCLVYFQSVLSFPNSFYAIYLGNLLVTFRFKKNPHFFSFYSSFPFQRAPFSVPNLCRQFLNTTSCWAHSSGNAFERPFGLSFLLIYISYIARALLEFSLTMVLWLSWHSLALP